MTCDAEGCGFQMLNDDEIVTSVQEESDPVDDETDEDEDNKGSSNADAFSALETAMECYELQGDKNGSQQREIRFILQFFFDKSQNASRVAEIANGVYGADTATANHVQFWFRRFRSDRLKLAIDHKLPELANRRDGVFHQDNARPHTSIVTRQKLWELSWEICMHPPI
ncbi:uncharacterized protein TNCV_1640141 [Trichonephila clavipes]|nr:uncharacterized protein TNCV_1640141 [Trichonephila clavipes]